MSSIFFIGRKMCNAVLYSSGVVFLLEIVPIVKGKTEVLGEEVMQMIQLLALVPAAADPACKALSGGHAGQTTTRLHVYIYRGADLMQPKRSQILLYFI